MPSKLAVPSEFVMFIVKGDVMLAGQNVNLSPLLPIPRHATSDSIQSHKCKSRVLLGRIYLELKFMS